jgi:hypothetical protein
MQNVKGTLRNPETHFYILNFRFCGFTFKFLIFQKKFPKIISNILLNVLALNVHNIFRTALRKY